MKKPFVPALIWLLVITGLSIMPGANLPSFNLIGLDKLGHAVVYGVLTFLILRGYTQYSGPAALARPSIKSRRSAGALTFAAGYGILMEFVQYTFIPGRFYEYDDMLANAIGALTGWLVFNLYVNRINRKS